MKHVMHLLSVVSRGTIGMHEITADDSCSQYFVQHVMQLLRFVSRGTFGVRDMTVGDRCSLYIGSQGTTKRTGLTPTTGIFDFVEITVASGGEITSTHDLTGVNAAINIKVLFILFRAFKLVYVFAEALVEYPH